MAVRALLSCAFVLAMSVSAMGDIMLTKLATDDPVVDTVSADLPNGGRNNYVLTNKKIIALDHNGDVNAELSGLQRTRAIAAIGYQIYVIGTTAAGNDLFLRKYRFDPGRRKIEFVSQSTDRVHLDLPATADLVIVGDEVWAISTNPIPPNSNNWMLRQYFRGNDEELLKKRDPRAPAIDRDYTDLRAVHGFGGSRDFLTLEHRMTVDPADSSIVYFAGAATTGSIPLSKIKVTASELKREAVQIELHRHPARHVLDLRATYSGVYLYAHDGGATTYLYRLDRNTLGNVTSACIQGRPEKQIGFGNLAFSNGRIYAVTRIANLNIKFLNRHGSQDGPERAGNTAVSYAIGKIDEDLTRWEQTAIIPQDGGSGTLALGYPFLADAGSAILLLGNITDGTANFAADKELSGKTTFALPLALNDLSLRDRSFELNVRAEIKDLTNAGATQSLNLPSGDVSPALGVTFYRDGDRVTVKMPEHAYSYGINNFLKLQGLTNAQIDEKIRDAALNSRYTPVGYTVTRDGDPQTVTGEGASVTVVMTRSTNVTFHFKREWALIIDSLVGELPGFTPGSGQALGNPEPPVGKHWIEENNVIAPMVDGIVTSATDAGTRYLNRAYVLNGGAERSWGSQAQRLQAPQFTMTGPAHYAYLWRAQHSVTVSTSTAQSAGLPALHYSGVPRLGSGVFWLMHGEPWKVAASDDPVARVSMRGVLNSGGALQDVNGFSRSDFPSDGGFTHQGKTYIGKFYPAITQAATISWDYGSTVFRQVVAIGNAVSMTGDGSGLFPEAERLTPAIAARIDAARAPTVTSVIEAPPGSATAEMMMWSPFERKAYPLRPGRFLIEWPVNDGGSPILTEITSRFPGDKVQNVSVDAVSGTIKDVGSGAAYIPLINTVAGQSNNAAESSDHAGSRHAPVKAFDGNTSSKFLLGGSGNARGANSGLVISPAAPAVVTALELVTGDDLPGRDPMTYTLEASANASGPWTLIASGSTGLPSGRLAAAPRIPINNRVAFAHYRLLFPTLRGPQIEMQVAEIRLLASPPPSPVRHYRALLHEAMPAIDLDRSTTDEIAFKQVAFSAATDPVTGTDIPPDSLTSPAILPIITGNKLLKFPVNEGNLSSAEGKHVLVLSKAAPGVPATGDLSRESLLVRVLETRRWNAEKEWDRATLQARPFRYYRFTPIETKNKTSTTRIRELTLLQNGSKPTATPILRSARAYEKSPTEGESHRLNDGAAADLEYADYSKTSPIIFEFAQPQYIDGFCFQVNRASEQLADAPVRWMLEGSDDYNNNYQPLHIQSAVDFDLSSRDSSGVTPIFTFQSSAFNLVQGPMAVSGANATIGTKIVDQRFDLAGIGTGFVISSRARYNINVYDRSRVDEAGPIIPVNRHFTGQAADELAVAWYERVDNILWPWRPAKYTAQWPQTKQRIVIASRLGSDGFDSDKASQRTFDPTAISDLQIYNQPNPNIPGFNPNEEHALVAGSLKFADTPNPPLAAYALRNDLNIGGLPVNTDANPGNDTLHPNYTSDPYVLVQYFDKAAGEHQMSVYKVEKEDTSIDTYQLRTKITKTSGGLPTHYFSSSALLEKEPVQIRVLTGALDGITSGRTYYVRRAGAPAGLCALSETPDGPLIGKDVSNTLSADLQFTRLYPYVFQYPTTVGRVIQAPNPLDSVIGPAASPETYGGNIGSYTDLLNPQARVYYEDAFGTPWTVSQGECFTRFFYRMRGDFWFKRKADGSVAGAADEGVQVSSGTSIAFAPEDAAKTEPQMVRFTAQWPENVPVLKVGESLTFVGGEYKQDHPEADGLPGVLGWAAGRIVFDSLNPSMDAEPAASVSAGDRNIARARTFTNYSARLISPLEPRSVKLAEQGLAGGDILKFKEAIAPATGITEVDGGVWRFTNLPASLKGRISFDPIGNQLGLRGFVNDKTLGDTTLTAAPPPAYILEPNILSPRDRKTLLEFKANRAEDTDLRAIIGGDKWQRVVDALFALSRNPANVRKSTTDNGDAASYYAGVDWAPQRDARGNVLRFGLGGSLPAGVSSGEIPNGAPRIEGKVIPTRLRGTPPSLLGPGLALVPSPFLLDPNPSDPAIKALLERQFKNPDDALYVTVAENDDPAIGGPVSMHVIKIVKKHRYRGALKLVEGDNAFSEKVTLRHTGDFGGNSEDIVYEWYYRPEDGRNVPWPYKSSSTIAPWQLFPDDSGASIAGLGMNQIDVAGKGKFILPDLWFITRYRHRNDVPGDATWTGTQHALLGKPDPELKKGELWAGAANSPQPNGDYLAQLIPGWLKRVLDRINPYEARFTDFRGDAPATYASMLQQAGPRFTGPVALNPDKNVIENTGLIELYQTLLDRGGKFAFAEPITDVALRDGVMNALQLAATRVQDLYMVLGNEAFADAQDPLVGFGSDSTEYGSAASSIWTFMNQTADPLEEELALLRGGSFDFGRPVHNRLFWNFTKDLGEVAYAQNYNLSDENGDGFINESDAMLRYPQGHGDAWGHYTTAVKMHYDLLRNSSFVWQPRSEFYSLLDVVIPVDFYDERKFTFAAAARAKAGADIVNATYRQRYTENIDGQWQGYTDIDTDRAWGVQEWAHRAGEAAFLDWATANSLIPAKAANRGAAIQIQSVTDVGGGGGGRIYRLALAPNASLPGQDAVGNAIRYLLTVTSPTGGTQEAIFQPDGPMQPSTFMVSVTKDSPPAVMVRFDNPPLLGLTNANFTLSAFDRPEGIQRVDRTTTASISQIATEFARIETTLANSDTGLNPLGLAGDAVPFDIDPNAFAGRDGRDVVSHFLQIWERARKALANANVIFNTATQQQNQVRRTQDSLDAFAGEVAKGDAELRNRLIEIFGTPHEGNIGSGKPYPVGYNGPDLFFHAYVDVKDVNSETVPHPSAESDEFTLLYAGFPQQLLLTDPKGIFQAPSNTPTGTTKDFTEVFQKLFLSDLGKDSNNDGVPDLFADARNVSLVDGGTLELKLPIRANGYAFQAPPEWGLRASTGELQALISDLVQAEADLALAVNDYTGAVGAIKDAAQILSAQYGIALEQVNLLTSGKERFVTLARRIAVLESTAAGLSYGADTADDLFDGILGFVPEDVILGLATGGDLFKAQKIPAFLVQRAFSHSARAIALGLEITATNLGPELETENFDVAIADAELAAKFEIQQRLIELKTMLGDEGPARIAVFHALEVLRQLSDAYRTKLQQGLALIEERQTFNRNAAGAVQEYRYQDMTFRVFRSEALEKYRAAFDLAARYTWLAAKAYDYETNLDSNDPASAQSILEDIVKARTLGVVPDGQPALGKGLAGALAALRDNYDVLSGQMGLNNAQSEDSKISLRTELFRINKSTASDADWRSKLTEYRVADLWQVPEFRRYCRPFAPAGTMQPGLVIPMETKILSGKNIFGQPLGPGDHAFDPTLFATKVNAVGVWFEGYDTAKLATAPRVYLVPAGLDFMTVPNSPTLATRAWNVVDQRIPVPHPLGGSPLGIANWRPVQDTLDGPLAEIRKFSSFRAYGSLAGSASVNTAEMSFDSRLVGRSVWNTRWLLIIPGVTFNADASKGLDILTSSEGIRDINIVFKTFGFSGN